MIVIENNKDEHLLLSALEFFVDYRFNTNSEMNIRYVKMIEQLGQNDYAVLCKKLNGKTDWRPLDE